MSKFEVVSGVGGYSLYLDDTRIAGAKPWGGGCLVKAFNTEENYVQERTCRIEQISETEMRCSACGYLYDWMEVDHLGDGKLSYDGDYCKGCGAKVVS